jgi:uncharacterized protein with PIN domain
MFPYDIFEDPKFAIAKCSRCGKPARQKGKPSPEIAPFIRGEVYMEITPLSFCHDCGKAFCPNCKNGMYCPDCNQLLLADPPSD